MNIKKTVSGGLILSAALLGSSARADMLQGLGEWTGTGSTFGPDGQAESDFDVKLTRTAVNPNTIEMRGEVTLASGQVIPFQQRMSGDDQRFTLDSGRGKGAGFCLGAGLCQSYEDQGNARAVATVIVIDSPDKIRILITELDHGRAVRFIRQTLGKR